MKKNKINKKLLLKQKGFVWTTRYSSDESTDEMGRWARICYYNGFYMAWVDGNVYQEEMPKLESRRTGVVNHFCVSLGFPTSQNQTGGYEKFTDFKEAQKYVEEMFNNFKKLINEK